ncbi:MAG TPA: hypothetical protein PLH57_05295, partial [Oligoflexia bacterium]|nr:hypothetical protein [Oligoflexia bacterium]
MNSAFKLNHPRVFRQLLTAAFTALALHATPLFAITGSNTSPSPTGSPLLQQRPAPSLKPLTEVTKDQSAFSACFLNFRKPNAETTKIKAALKKLNFNIISINSDSLKYGSFDKLCTDIKNQLSSEKRISTAPTCDVLVIDADFDIRFHNALNAPERHATAGMYELLYGKCSGNCPTLLSNVSQVFVVGANTPLTIARPIAKKAFSDNLEKRGYPPDMIESLWSYRLQEISKHKAGQITSATIFQNAFGPTVDLFAVDLGIIDPSSSRQELQLERTLYSAEIRTLKKRIASKRKIRFSEKLFEFFHLTKPEKPAKKISWEKTKLEALIGQMNNPGFLYCEQDFSTTKDAQSACEQFFNDNRLNSSSLKIFDDPLNLEEEIERHRYTRQFGKLNFRRDERLRELKIENRKLPRSMNIYAAMAYSTDFTHSGYVFDRDFWVKHFELNHIKERLTGAPPSLKEADKLCQEFSNISYHLLPSNTAINPEWYQSIGGVLLLTCILDVGPYWASRADILNSPSDDDQITFLAHTIDTSAEATSSLPRSLKLVEKTGCTAYRFIQNGLASKNPDFHAIATKAAVTLYTTISTCSRAGTEHQALVTAFKDILKTTDIGSWSLKEHAIDVYLDQLWASNSLKFIWSDLYDTLTHPENQRFATLERALRLGSWLTDANDLTRLVDDFKAAEPGGSEWRFLAATLQSAAQHNRISEKQKKSLNLNSSTFKKMEKYLDNSIDLFLLAC